MPSVSVRKLTIPIRARTRLRPRAITFRWQHERGFEPCVQRPELRQAMRRLLRGAMCDCVDSVIAVKMLRILGLRVCGMNLAAR